MSTTPVFSTPSYPLVSRRARDSLGSLWLRWWVGEGGASVVGGGKYTARSVDGFSLSAGAGGAAACAITSAGES